jgi:hypothetical protein
MVFSTTFISLKNVAQRVNLHNLMFLTYTFDAKSFSYKSLFIEDLQDYSYTATSIYVNLF